MASRSPEQDASERLLRLRGRPASAGGAAAHASRGGVYERVATAAAIVLAAVGVAGTLLRLRYGADFIDESFYAATAYRFALGGRPLLDDLDVHQTAAWMVTPYVRAHLAVFGDTTGLLLSLRLLWALLNGAAAVLSYRFVRRLIDRRLALVAAVCGFALMPYMIPAPSFNTLAVIFGSMAVSLIGVGILEERGRVTFALAGVMLGLAAFAYPTVVVVALVVILGVRSLTRSWREPAWILAGGLFAGAVAIASLAPYLHGITKVIEFNRMTSQAYDWGGAAEGPLGKAARIVGQQGAWSVAQASAWLALVVGLLQRTRHRVPSILAVALVLALPFRPIGQRAYADIGTLLFATSVMIAAAVVGFTMRRSADRPDTSRRLRVLRGALLYGLLSAAVFAMTSSNGVVFLGLGAASVMGPCLAVVLGRLQASLSPRIAGRAAPLMHVLCGGVVLGALVWMNATGAYRDLPPSQLHSVVTAGPHAGLVTTEANASGSERLWKSMRTRSNRGDRLLAYHGLPAAYLFTHARPSLTSLWIASYDAVGRPEITQWVLEELSDPECRPTIVVKNLGWPNGFVLAANSTAGYDPSRDAVEAYVQADYEAADRDSDWELLIPRR